MKIVSFRICSSALSLLAAVLIIVTGLGNTAGAQNADKPSPGELILILDASSGSGLADAIISITDSITGGPVAGGRTYTDPKNNPKEYVLSPGTYKVVVKAVKLKDSSPEEFEVEVKQGEKVERNAQFSE